MFRDFFLSFRDLILSFRGLLFCSSSTFDRSLLACVQERIRWVETVSLAGLNKVCSHHLEIIFAARDCVKVQLCDVERAFHRILLRELLAGIINPAKLVENIHDLVNRKVPCHFLIYFSVKSWNLRSHFPANTVVLLHEHHHWVIKIRAFYFVKDPDIFLEPYIEPGPTNFIREE